MPSYIHVAGGGYHLELKTSLGHGTTRVRVDDDGSWHLADADEAPVLTMVPTMSLNLATVTGTNMITGETVSEVIMAPDLPATLTFDVPPSDIIPTITSTEAIDAEH